MSSETKPKKFTDTEVKGGLGNDSFEFESSAKEGRLSTENVKRSPGFLQRPTFSESAISSGNSAINNKFRPSNLSMEVLNGLGNERDTEKFKGEFDVDEETALLLEDIDNPYSVYRPENFGLLQKEEWLMN